LRPAEDARLIDSTAMVIEETVAEVLAEVRRKLGPQSED
jgi:cytidylate kinase